MRTLGKLCAAFGVLAAGLVFAATALAQPRLMVSQKNTAVTVVVRQKAVDAQPARIAVFVPAGYQMSTGQSVGTTIGSASGNFFLRDANDRPELVSGDITVAPATTPSSSSCAAGTHRATWMLNLTGNTIKLQVPIFVSRAGGNETRYGGQRLLLCLGPADVGAGTAGRSPSGAQLLRLAMTFRGVFVPPVGNVVWKSLTTPFAAGSSSVATNGTVESRAYVGRGAVIFRVARVNRRAHLYRFAGRVTTGGRPAVRATVRILVNGRVRFTAVTRQNGGYSIVRRVGGRGVFSFRARAIGGALDVTSTACAKSTLAGIACVSATTNPFSTLSGVVQLRV